MIGRREECYALSLAFAAREHCLLVGEPGTGKSKLVKQLARQTGLTYYKKLMMKQTVLDEIAGPIDAKAYLNGAGMKRITTATMMEAHIVFLDEIYKANSAIINALLTAMEEREFENPDPQPIPLHTLVGASNELPTGKDAETLRAAHDRFLIRVVVESLPESQWMDLGKYATSAYTAAGNADSVIQLPKVPREQVAFAPDAVSMMRDLRMKFAKEYGIKISDRRFCKCFEVLQAAASLAGRAVTNKDDFAALRFVFWSEWAEWKTSREVCFTFANPNKAEIEKMLDSARKKVADIRARQFASDSEKINSFGGILKELAGIQERMEQKNALPEEIAEIESFRDEFDSFIAATLGLRRRS